MASTRRARGAGLADASASRAPAVLVAVAGVLVIVVHQVEPTGAIGRTTYLIGVIGAALIAWAGVVRHDRPDRTPWTWVAAGLTASALGDVAYELVLVTDGVAPDASVADAFWVASYVLLGIGLRFFLRSGQRDDRADLDGLIDVASVGTVAILIAWQVVIAPTVTDVSIPAGIRAVWAAYPILDSVLLALLVRVLLTGHARSWTGGLLAVGVVSWLVSDFTYLFVAAAGSSYALDVGWMVGPLLMAAAAFRGGSARRSAASLESSAPGRVGAWRLAVPFLPLLAPAIIEYAAFREGDDADPVPLAVATAVLIGLAFARAVRLLRAGERAQARVRSRERYFRALAANSSDAVLVVDAGGRIQNDSPAVVSMLGHEGAPTAGTDMLALVLPEDAAAARSVFDQTLLLPGHVFGTELRVRHADGSVVWLSARAVNLTDDPDVGAVVINLHDVTARKQAEEELSHRAFHDSLTGLPNRALFRNRVEHALDRNTRTGIDPAIIYVDLDGFKSINDQLGHDVGDEVLQEVADRLEEAVRSGDTVARLGGDEFAILIEPSNRSLDEAVAIAERVLQVLDAPLLIGGHELSASASLGVAVGDAESTATSLLRNADVAMYRAKNAGKGRWVLYQPDMRTDALERLQLESDLATVTGSGQLRLVFQPVLELESQHLVGFEALLRWHHPTLGVVGPDRFIALAEANGQIVPIGRWVLMEACAVAARWRHRWPDLELSMAVNVSARQLTSHQLVDDVATALDETGLPAGALILEMTETALVEDASAVTNRLHELRELGVRLAIDDFGTGYSSLSYLRQFPVDILKIDRSFIDTITDHEQLPAIVKGLLDLSRTLELETVAEGIETTTQCDRLRQEACVLGQGFLFSKPLPAEEAEALLDQVDPIVRTAQVR